ncbi:hypothetical protein ACJRO7_012252 [Eucalyptus globulus]|uniref:Uncharacterized protein n=1 Tax=Eucalyptus globulus TaxID=34317 RepID=A0ABD3LHX6_EUCGL
MQNQLHNLAGGENISGGGMVSIMECSLKPKKNAIVHHMKTSPGNAPLPPLPPDWTLASSGGGDDADAASGTAYMLHWWLG